MAELTTKAWIATPSGAVTSEHAIYPPQHLKDFRRFLDWDAAPTVRPITERLDAASADNSFQSRVNAARFRF